MATKFRTSMTSTAGHDSAKVCQGRIINVNLVKWTVDVIAQFDRKRYFNIQVSTPYLHHANGEGIYVMPEVNAQVMVCIPSDSTAPFVMSFIMATETVDASADDAPLGTTQHAQAPANPTDSSFAGGRPQAQPGDIVLRTRDNNFVILHRGGVLQVGSTPLAQRLYIPLQNLIMDVSENYEHQNSGGAIKWGIQQGPSQMTYPTQWMQTFRVFAENQYADVRITCGDVLNPLGDPDGGAAAAAAGLGQNNDMATASNCILYEVAVSPQGFNANTGEPNDGALAASVMRFAFDRQGNLLFRMQGNFSQQVMGTYTISVVGDVDIESTTGMLTMKASNGATIDGGPSTNIKGTVVRLGVGQTPVARNGDFVRIVFAPGVPSPPLVISAPVPVAGSPTGPWSIVPGTPIVLTGLVWGTISTGNPAVLA
jgi:hypothetical protein